MKRQSDRIPRAGAALGMMLLPLLISAGGCISGRVLTGYPGYPFARFDSPLPSDSTFFLLQPAIESEGFPLDYTVLDEGLITTRSAEYLGRPVFLNVVVEPLVRNDSAGSPKPDQTRTRVWVAAYEETVSGAERINPLQEDVWAGVMDLASRLSAAVDGSTPIGPQSGSEGGSASGPQS